MTGSRKHWSHHSINLLSSKLDWLLSVGSSWRKQALAAALKECIFLQIWCFCPFTASWLQGSKQTLPAKALITVILHRASDLQHWNQLILGQAWETTSQSKIWLIKVDFSGYSDRTLTNKLTESPRWGSVKFLFLWVHSFLDNLISLKCKFLKGKNFLVFSLYLPCYCPEEWMMWKPLKKYLLNEWIIGLVYSPWAFQKT